MCTTHIPMDWWLLASLRKTFSQTWFKPLSSSDWPKPMVLQAAPFYVVLL